MAGPLVELDAHGDPRNTRAVWIYVPSQAGLWRGICPRRAGLFAGENFTRCAAMGPPIAEAILSRFFMKNAPSLRLDGPQGRNRTAWDPRHLIFSDLCH